MLVFFLGGISLPVGDVNVYLMFALLPMIAGLAVASRNIRLSGAHVPFLVMSLAIGISCLFLAFEGGSYRELSGLEILLYGWLALLSGSVLNVSRGRALSVGGYTLFCLIAVSFVFAWQTTGGGDLVAFFLQPGQGDLFKAQLGTVFGFSNFLAAFMLFFLGYGALSRNILLTVTAFAGIVLTISRAATIVAIVFLAAVLMDAAVKHWLPFVSARVRHVVTATSVIVATGLAASTAYIGALASGNLKVLTLTGRTVVWNHAVALIAQHPFIGNGNGAITTPEGGSSAHNWILDAWVSYGVFAMLGFSLYIFYAMWRFYRAGDNPRSAREQAISRGILAGLVLTAIDGMVEPLVFSIPYAVFIGLLAGGPRPFAEPNPAGDPVAGVSSIGDVQDAPVQRSGKTGPRR